jgi:hypothetical protein
VLWERKTFIRSPIRWATLSLWIALKGDFLLEKGGALTIEIIEKEENGYSH